MNGHNNKDGTDWNHSYNYGIEGDKDIKDENIIKIRNRQIYNYIIILLLSRGIIMIKMGDEYGHSQLGNNNSYN